MKRFFFFILVLTSQIFAFHAPSFASEEKLPVNASVTVNPTFGITVTPPVITFSGVDQGSVTGEETVVVECMTNNNKSWAVAVNCESPLTSGEHIIPNENFLWYATTQGGGTIDEGTGHMDTAPFEFYNAGIDEYITVQPVRIDVTFKVEIPPMQAAGDYTSAVVFTMHEE